MQNFYTLLEINSTATKEEIQKAYKIKSKDYHPDINGGSKVSNDMFKILHEGKETLLDDKKRLEHDYHFGIKKRPPVDTSAIRKKYMIRGAAVGGGVALLIMAIFSLFNKKK